MASSVSINGKSVYLGDYDGRFSRVDIDTEKIAWTWEQEKIHLPFVASPALLGNNVVIGNNDKHVYCFNKQNGKLIWKYNTGKKVDGSAIIVDGKVIVGNSRGDLLLLDLKDGKRIWSYEIGSDIIGNAAVVSKKIIVGALDGTIYCFGN